MKLPKTGKVKLPKTGNKKLPSFHLKNGFIKKNLVTLIAIAVLLVGSGTAYGTLASREADRGFDPVDGVNEDRYQVLVSGEGYKLNKQQEKNYKLQKKQNEVNAERTAMNGQNPTNIRTSSGTRYYRSSNYRYRYKGSTYKITRNPRMTTNLQSQIRSQMNWKAGEKLKFMVAAYAYPYGTKNAISKDNIIVTAKGGTLKHDGEKYGYQWYTLTLAEGTNTITITVKDKKTKKKYKAGPYKVTAGKGSTQTGKTDKPDKPTNPTDPTNPTNPKEEIITFDFGYGAFTSNPMVITDDTTALDILKNTKGIALDGDEVISVKGDMSNFSLEDYDQDDLKKIFKKEKGDDARKKLKDKIVEELGDAAEEMSDEEINGLVDDAFDDFFNDYIADFFDGWKTEIEDKVKDKGKIGDGFPFDEFKWTYTNAKGKDAASKMDLKLILVVN